MNYVLTLDVAADELTAILHDDVDTGAGWVDVQLAGPWPAGDVATLKITGELPAILAWMINTSVDTDQAIKDFADAAANERLQAE